MDHVNLALPLAKLVMDLTQQASASLVWTTLNTSHSLVHASTLVSATTLAALVLPILLSAQSVVKDL